MIPFLTISLSPFWKQVVGAGIGAAAALLLYGTYVVASPLLASTLAEYGTGSAVADAEVASHIAENREQNMAAVAAETRQIIEDIAAGWHVPVSESIEDEGALQ